MEINLSLNKFAAMSYYEDDYDEQYEEYCRRYEEEEIFYVDGGILNMNMMKTIVHQMGKRSDLILQWLRKV